MVDRIASWPKDDDAFQSHLQEQRHAILSILSNALPPAADTEPYMGQECVGLGDAWRALYALVRSSVHEHEGNSCIVVGESGCGKSLLVESVLRRIKAECHDKEQMGQHASPWTVSLSALVHPTDRQCLSDMARQLMDQGAMGLDDVDDILGREQQDMDSDTESDDRPLAEWASASLPPTMHRARSPTQTGMGLEAHLALDPEFESEHLVDADVEEAGMAEEDDDEEGEGVEELVANDNVVSVREHAAHAQPNASASVPDSFAQSILSTLSATLSHILSLLTRTSSTGETSHKRPLVIVLDQFEQFAQRPRQALLYCLLDAVQAASYAPGLLIIGLSTRVDAPDFLEKRVKSRFSHRSVHVHPPSFEQYIILTRTALLAGASPSTPFGKTWCHEVDALLQDSAFRACIQHLHALSGDVRLLYQALTPPVAALSVANPCLEAGAFVHAAELQRHDPTLAFMLELSMPEMVLMITARHLQLSEHEPFTFEMCFHHICQFVKRAQRDLGTAIDATERRIVNVSMAGLDALASREPMQQAFQRLLDAELLLPEPARVTLALPSGIASRTGTVTSPYGTLPGPTVIPTFLRVRSQVSAKAILESVCSPERVEPLSSLIVKWAESTGL